MCLSFSGVFDCGTWEKSVESATGVVLGLIWSKIMDCME